MEGSQKWLRIVGLFALGLLVKGNKTGNDTLQTGACRYKRAVCLNTNVAEDKFEGDVRRIGRRLRVVAPNLAWPSHVACLWKI